MRMFSEELKQYATINEAVSFKTLTTLRIGGTADYVAYPKSMLALSQCIQCCVDHDVPFKIIGKGSNLLCSDKAYHGVVIRLDRTLCDFYIQDNHCLVEAGCSIIALTYALINEGLSGLEFASGIPGTVGGLTYMNAGAYKSKMKDVIKEVLVYKEGNFEWLSNEECNFSYRYSIFHDHPDWVILAVRLELQKGDPNEIKALIDDRRQRRMDTQPLNFPSAGSFFKNFEDYSAWKCIEDLGYRGKQIGGAMVSDKHANFLVNVGDAKAEDFLKLVDLIQESVLTKYGRRLIMEVEQFNFD